MTINRLALIICLLLAGNAQASLSVTQLIGFGAAAPAAPATMKSIISALDLLGKTVLLVDVGDSDSYAGTGQTLTDVSGGTEYNLFRGATASAATDDPTFVSADLASFFEHDGADFFRQTESLADFGADEGDSFHKNNATWTMLMWVYVPNTSGNDGLFGTSGGQSANIGVTFKLDGTEKMELDVDAGGSRALSFKVDSGLSNSEWHLIAVSIDEATGSGGGFFWADGEYVQVSSADTFDASYSSPSSSAATHTLDVGSSGNGAQIISNTFRVAAFVLFDDALTKANLDDIWDQTRARFGK